MPQNSIGLTSGWISPVSRQLTNPVSAARHSDPVSLQLIVFVIVVVDVTIIIIIIIIAMETFGPLNMAGFQFLNELGRRISQESDDSRECAFLFQTIQRFNAVAIQGTFAMRTTH